MSLNVSWVRALRAIVIGGLILALFCAMLGSVGLDADRWSWTDSADGPGALPPKGMPTFGTTVPR